MFRFLKAITVLSFAAALQSCVYSVAHKPVVAAPYQPVVVSKKKEFQGSLSVRPFKYAGMDLTYAITDHFGIRASYTGTYQFTSLSGSLIYFNNFKKLNYFVAPIYSYQNNQITRDKQNIAGSRWKSYSYNCLYNSAGIVAGVSINTNDGVSHHLNFKTQYNFVEKYNYSFEDYDEESFLKIEKLDYKIPNFFTFEPSYSLLIPTGKKSGSFFNIQLGVFIAQTTLRYTYTYTKNPSYNTSKEIARTLHPVSVPINLTITYGFSSRN